MEAGCFVLLGGVRWKVQYVTSKGTLDLKSEADGEVQYGVDPATVERAPPQQEERQPLEAGCFVLLGGVRWKVQYVTSKGTLDLKSEADGEVQYGVDPATVVLEHAPAAEERLPQHGTRVSLLGSQLTLWDRGNGYTATVVAVDDAAGRAQLCVRYPDSARRRDEWVEPWRVKQARRVEAAAEAMTRWQSECASQPDKRSAGSGMRPPRRVRISPLPADEPEWTVPEWICGERPEPPSASSVEQRDGVWVTIDKYPDAIARSFARSTALEKRERRAVHDRAVALGCLPSLEFGAVEYDGTKLTARWLMSGAIKGEMVAETDAWLGESDVDCHW